MTSGMRFLCLRAPLRNCRRPPQNRITSEAFSSKVFRIFITCQLYLHKKSWKTWENWRNYGKLEAFHSSHCYFFEISIDFPCPIKTWSQESPLMRKDVLCQQCHLWGVPPFFCYCVAWSHWQLQPPQWARIPAAALLPTQVADSASYVAWKRTFRSDSRIQDL